MDRKETVRYFYEIVVTDSMKIIRQYCDGDHVISEFIMKGTHKRTYNV